jgi:hypothetical protein
MIIDRKLDRLAKRIRRIPGFVGAAIRVNGKIIKVTGGGRK